MKNPKQKLKNILLLVTVLFTFSCSKDAYDENLNLDSRDYHFKKINFLELSHINNQAFIESAKLKKVLPADKHNSIESISDFDIDLQNIQYLKKTNNQETFSFRVLQSATATFSQNIVIDCKPNQSPQTYLVTYYLNKQLGQISTNDMFTNSITSTSTVPLNSSSSNVTNSIGCVDVGYYDLVNACEGELVTPGEKPECFNSDGTRRQVLVFKIVASDCSDDGGGFNSGANLWMNNPQNPSLGGGGIGGSGQNSSNLDIFIPNFYNSYDLSVLPTNNMAQINQFIYNLYSTDDDKKAVVESTEWLLAYTNFWIGVNGGLSTANQNALTFAFNNMVSVFNQFPSTFNNQSQSSSFKYKAFQFLLKNGAWLSGQSATTQQNILQNLISIEKIDKINQLINVAIATNTTFTIDPTINSTNGQVFNNTNDLEDYLLSFNNGIASNVTIEDNGANTKTTRFSFDTGGFCNLNVQVKQKLQTSTQNYSIENVSSSISGATLATEWHQNNDNDLNIVGNTASVTFTGTLSMNCFFDGIGVFYSDILTIKSKFNTNTGTLTSGLLYGLD